MWETLWTNNCRGYLLKKKYILTVNLYIMFNIINEIRQGNIQ